MQEPNKGRREEFSAPTVWEVYGWTLSFSFHHLHWLQIPTDDRLHISFVKTASGSMHFQVYKHSNKNHFYCDLYHIN